MELLILGSGTGALHPDRTACSALVRVSGQAILIDCGPGVLLRLRQEGTDPQGLDAILLTHFHPDHTLDLWAYYFAARAASFHRPRSEPLALVAGRDYDDLARRLAAAYGDHVVPPEGLVRPSLLSQTSPTPAFAPPPLTGLTVTAAPVVHRPESLAYRLETGGKSLVFSGDTDWSDGLIDLAVGADWLVCEAALPEGLKKKGHLTPGLAGRIAARAGVGGLILTHLYPEHDGIDPLPPARTEFSGPILVAEDGLRVEI